ncbi:redoxin domain-containing protein [Haloquadratum walsbyi]|jgi:Peroxiredoxin|uniref:Peroxiredoxin n=1 Tax=Haloquadratum walsbyi J07HQW2 TaxID=1238425 RepID=U1NER0_9EURY|nr:redoxin domain-containing protein [Haloquadratum walsbyi]ERG95253.1 MAG: peroxiredoxin [Haloquadratum walsbyi J07HQW2]
MAAEPSPDDPAPTFEATVANGDVESFALDDVLGDGPVVLAFFPGAFTPPCSNEMVALEEHLSEFEEAGATVYGVSADSAFSLNAFRDEHDLSFNLVSDMDRNAIDAYDTKTDIGDLGLLGVSNRAVFILDEDGTVSYAWEADEPTTEPDYDELVAAVEDK